MSLPQTVPEWLMTIMTVAVFPAIGWACRELKTYLTQQQENSAATMQRFVDYLIAQEQRAEAERAGWLTKLDSYRQEMIEHTAVSKQMYNTLEELRRR